MSSPGDESDPNATIPPMERYLRAEGWFDRHVAPLVVSPLTLALFVAWMIAMLAFGFWVGLKP